MLTTRTLIAAAALTGFLGQASADSPIAWWKFDELGGTNAADSAGANPGTLAGAASFVGGISGNALSATGGWASMGNVLPMTGTSFSMQTWIKTTSTSSASTIIAGKHDAGSFNGYMMRTNRDTANYGTLGMASFYQSNSQGNTAVGTTTVTDGQWHCLIATYNTIDSTLRLYVDGSPESLLATKPIINNAVAFMVGGVTVNGNQTNNFDGVIDEVQLYDYALTQDQVTFLTRNPGQAVPVPGTLGLALVAAGAIARRRR